MDFDDIMSVYGWKLVRFDDALIKARKELTDRMNIMVVMNLANNTIRFFNSTKLSFTLAPMCDIDTQELFALVSTLKEMGGAHVKRVD